MKGMLEQEILQWLKNPNHKVPLGTILELFILLLMHHGKTHLSHLWLNGTFLLPTFLSHRQGSSTLMTLVRESKSSFLMLSLRYCLVYKSTGERQKTLVSVPDPSLSGCEILHMNFI